MADELQMPTANPRITTGSVAAIIYNEESQVWDEINDVWDNWSDTGVANYLVGLSQLGASGRWVGSFPTAITAAGIYSIVFYSYSGSPGNVSQLTQVGEGTIDWDGQEEVQAAQVEPLTLAEAKLHLRYMTSDQDTLISSLIPAAREWIETFTRKTVRISDGIGVLSTLPLSKSSVSISYTGVLRTLWLDHFHHHHHSSTFPGGWQYPRHPHHLLELPNPPVVQVLAIEYVDTNGNYQVVSPSNYQVDNTSDYYCRIKPVGNTGPGTTYDWPSVEHGQINRVAITYAAGYPNGAPETVRQCMRLLIDHWFRNRTAAGEAQIHEVPFAVTALLGSLRTF